MWEKLSYTMVEVSPGLFVGDQASYEREVKDRPGWRVVQACKEPYHRDALGYTTRGAPKGHPEYWVARRRDRLILNLVDVTDPSYFAPEIFDAALAFIHEGVEAGLKVLVHCNQGESRGPGVAMAYLAAFTDVLPDEFSEAEDVFRGLYPKFNPGAGMRGFLVEHWNVYRRRSTRTNGRDLT